VTVGLDTSGPIANTTVVIGPQPGATSLDCAASDFAVFTYRFGTDTVCKTVSSGSCTATASVVTSASPSNSVSFDIVIP
jgi:hypothetical protein